MNWVLLLLVTGSLFGEASCEYDQRVATKMINVAAATYKKAPQEHTYSAFAMNHVVRTFDLFGQNDLLAIIGFDAELKALIVGFRGSDNTKNWIIDDARIKKTEYPQCQYCKVHTGFKDAYQKLQSQGLNQKIKESLSSYKPATLIFTGHSLGGAIANIAALRCKEEGYANGLDIQLYTFGQPRVGNKRYANYHSVQIEHNYRVVHNRDVVVHKPAFLIGYRHSGTELWYSQAMKLIIRRCEGQSALCSNSLGSFLTDYDPKDHGSANYLKLGL